jgi:hypothetical protein
MSTPEPRPPARATSQIEDVLAAAQREVAEIVEASEAEAVGRLEARRADLDRREAELRTLAGELDARSRALAARSDGLLERSRLVEARMADVEARARALERRREVLDERDAELAQIAAGLLRSSVGVQDLARRLVELPPLTVGAAEPANADTAPRPSTDAAPAETPPVVDAAAAPVRVEDDVPAPDVVAPADEPETGVTVRPEAVAPTEEASRIPTEEAPRTPARETSETTPVRDARSAADGASAGATEAAGGTPAPTPGAGPAEAAAPQAAPDEDGWETVHDTDPEGAGPPDEGLAFGRRARRSTRRGTGRRSILRRNDDGDEAFDPEATRTSPAPLRIVGASRDAERAADDRSDAATAGSVGPRPVATDPAAGARQAGDGGPGEDARPAADTPEQLDSARLVALSMAAQGRPREDVEAVLRDELGIVEHESLIDYVFGISTPSSVVPSWPPRRRRRT